MKNTSILIPIILIVCLGLLIYLFYAALQATDDNAGTGNNPIVLNQADYADGSPGDLGDNANLEPYFQDVPEDEKTVDLGSTAAADTPTTGVPQREIRALKPPQLPPLPPRVRRRPLPERERKAGTSSLPVVLGSWLAPVRASML